MLLGVHAYHPHRFRSWGLHFLTVGSSVACSAFWLAAISFGVILILRGNAVSGFKGWLAYFALIWLTGQCGFDSGITVISDFFYLCWLAGWLADWLAGWLASSMDVVFEAGSSFRVEYRTMGEF